MTTFILVFFFFSAIWAIKQNSFQKKPWYIGSLLRRVKMHAISATRDNNCLSKPSLRIATELTMERLWKSTKAMYFFGKHVKNQSPIGIQYWVINTRGVFNPSTESVVRANLVKRGKGGGVQLQRQFVYPDYHKKLFIPTFIKTPFNTLVRKNVLYRGIGWENNNSFTLLLNTIMSV